MFTSGRGRSVTISFPSEKTMQRHRRTRTRPRRTCRIPRAPRSAARDGGNRRQSRPAPRFPPGCSPPRRWARGASSPKSPSGPSSERPPFVPFGTGLGVTAASSLPGLLMSAAPSSGTVPALTVSPCVAVSSSASSNSLSSSSSYRSTSSPGAPRAGKATRFDALLSSRSCAACRMRPSCEVRMVAWLGPGALAALERAVGPLEDLERGGLACPLRRGRMHDLSAIEVEVADPPLAHHLDHPMRARQAFHLDQVPETGAAQLRRESPRRRRGRDGNRAGALSSFISTACLHSLASFTEIWSTHRFRHAKTR